MDEASLQKSVRAAIRERRTVLEMSQEAFAYLIKLHRANYSKIERGERNVTLATHWRVTLGLGIEPSQLMREAESNTIDQPHMRARFIRLGAVMVRTAEFIRCIRHATSGASQCGKSFDQVSWTRDDQEVTFPDSSLGPSMDEVFVVAFDTHNRNAVLLPNIGLGKRATPCF